MVSIKFPWGNWMGTMARVTLTLSRPRMHAHHLLPCHPAGSCHPVECARLFNGLPLVKKKLLNFPGCPGGVGSFGSVLRGECQTAPVVRVKYVPYWNRAALKHPSPLTGQSVVATVRMHFDGIERNKGPRLARKERVHSVIRNAAFKQAPPGFC